MVLFSRSDIKLYFPQICCKLFCCFFLLQAEELLRHEKHTWLQNHILYTETQELLLDYELRSLDMSLSSRDHEVLAGSSSLSFQLKSSVSACRKKKRKQQTKKVIFLTSEFNTFFACYCFITVSFSKATLTYL